VTQFILFVGAHCKNCLPMKQNLDKCSIKYDEVSTDTDKGKMMAGIFRITGVPSLAIAKDGRPVHTFPSGLLPVNKLDEIRKKFK
jgi:thioredoxin-like negative regulator of GroEL